MSPPPLTALDFDVTNATPEDIVALNRALAYLNKSPAGDAIMRQVADQGVTINIVHDGEDQYFNHTIDWDPNSALAVKANTPGMGAQGVQSAALGLAHEGAHATDPRPVEVQDAERPDAYDNEGEKYAVDQENIVAVELGEPQRFNHRFEGLVQEADPTEHTTVIVDGSLSEGTVWVRVDEDGNPIVQAAYQLGTFPLDAPVFAPDATTVFDDSGTRPWLSETSTWDSSGVLQSQLDVLDSGTQLLKYYDTHDTHPYTEVDITRDILGHITGTNVTTDVNVAAIGGSIGQVLGSAIGRALAPNNQFAQLAAGTVAGAIGQKLALALSSSLTADATQIAVGDIFNNFRISLASAGAGSVASFLTAELGTALGLSGYGAQLFNAGVGGFAGSVAQQVVLNGGLGSLASLSWSAAFTASEVNIGGALGSILAHQIIHAQTQAGAIGGQIAGAVAAPSGLRSSAMELALSWTSPSPGSAR